MQLGIFGGSFDPVHLGHLALAKACHENAALDEIWFTPTAVQPLKRQGPRATDAQRVEMLKLAITRAPLRTENLPTQETWRVCTLEIERGGLSYTVDTIRQIHTELPTAKLYFLIGADAILDVPRWHRPNEIFALATPLVVRRAGRPDPDLRELARLCAAENQPRLVKMPAVDVSSSEIRRRAAASQSIAGLVPPEVDRYIAAHRLYT